MEALEVTRLDGERGLRLAGDLDMLSGPELVEAFASLPKDGAANGQPKLDLSGVTFLDSSGLRAIMEIAGRTNGDGPLVLEGLSPTVLRVFEITNLSRHPQLEIR